MEVSNGRDIYEDLLLKGIKEEEIKFSFKSIRDRVILTNKRIISINVQGLTGKKKDFLFIPFSKIVAHSIESAGRLDFDSEMKIWLSGIGQIEFKFMEKTDIRKIGRFLNQHINVQ